MKIIRTGSTIPFQNYTILNQRNFGFVSNLRNKLSRRITSSVVNDINAIPEIKGAISKSKPVRLTKDTRTKLYKIARDKNARVSTINVGGSELATKDTANSVLTDARYFPNRTPRLRKYRKRALEENVGKYQVLIPPKVSGDSLAHEIGHVINQESKDPVIRKIAQISANPKARIRNSEGYNLITSENGPGNHGRHGIKNTLRDFIESKSILSDERRASKNGIKLLRKTGANKENISVAEENMRNALELYRRKGDINWKTTLRNTLQSKNRKTGDIFLD